MSKNMNGGKDTPYETIETLNIYHLFAVSILGMGGVGKKFDVVILKVISVRCREGKFWVLCWLLSFHSSTPQKFLKICQVMTKDGPSKQKKKFTTPGTLASLASQKKSLIPLKNTASVVQPNNRGPVNVVEEHQRRAPSYPVVASPVQPESTPSLPQPVEQVQPPHAVEEQVQQDATTTVEDEQREEGPSEVKRKRGRTMMQSVHGRSDRKRIELNGDGQAIGPTDSVASEFGSFLGTLARNATLCPLDKDDWRKMDTKEAIWDYIKSKYNIPEFGKKWALQGVSTDWRRYKNQLNDKHYKKFETDELRLQNMPEGVPEPQFKALLEYWNSEKAQNMSKTNTENRKKMKHPHTVEKKSFALVRQKKEKENSGPLSDKQFFVAIRTRKPGRTYKCSDEDTTQKIAEMEALESQQSEEDGGSVNAFTSVMGPEHPRRVRLYGRGVTKSSLKGNVGASSSGATEDQLKDTVQRLVEEQMVVERKSMEEREEANRKKFIVDFLAAFQRSGACSAQFDVNAIVARMNSSGESFLGTILCR